MNNQNAHLLLIKSPEDPITQKSVEIESSVTNLQDVKSFSNVCRTCATNTEFVIPIFHGEGLQNNLADKIHEHLPIQVTLEDSLPVVMCYQCASTLLAWHELALCCRRADLALRDLLQHRQHQLQNGKATTSTEEITVEPQNKDNSTMWNSCSVSFQSYHDALSGMQRDTGPSLTSRNMKAEDGNTFEIEFAPKLETQEICSDDDNLSEGRVESDFEDDNDNKPLSVLAKEKSKTDVFNNFYSALISFRNHFVSQHKNKKDKPNYPDFTDSSDSEVSVEGIDNNLDDKTVDDIDKYDDLTEVNKRRDKMDEKTRLELAEVKTKINGKIFYTCKLCSKHLCSTHTYIFHKRIHTGERPCVCHICGKQFRVPNTLKRHLTETHQRLRRHACSMCNKTFVNSQNLKHHIRIHTGEKPYVCSQCGKRFTQSAALYTHAKLHSDDYPFVCVECGAKFKVRGELARHGLKHTGEKPHVCFYCSKSYRTRHQLNVHIVSHTGTKPFVCVVCGVTFATQRTLRRHTKRLHETSSIPSTLPYNQVLHY